MHLLYIGQHVFNACKMQSLENKIAIIEINSLSHHKKTSDDKNTALI